MSQWRKEASKQLPELQNIISSPQVDNPMMLWIELNLQFEKECDLRLAPIDLLRRIWNYGLWCLRQSSKEVSTAAALGFFEHAIDTPGRISLLPTITTRSVLEGFRDLLLHHNAPEEFEKVMNVAFPQD